MADVTPDAPQDERGERNMQGACFDCGRRYGDQYGFPDLLVPTPIWKLISPTRDEGGLLCPSCIVRRCYLHGVGRCPSHWASGPLLVEHDPAWLRATAAEPREPARGPGMSSGGISACGCSWYNGVRWNCAEHEVDLPTSGAATRAPREAGDGA